MGVGWVHQSTYSPVSDNIALAGPALISMIGPEMGTQPILIQKDSRVNFEIILALWSIFEMYHIEQ